MKGYIRLRSSSTWILLTLAMLAGFFLRTHLLAGQELWGDEAMSTCMAQLPLGEVIAPGLDTHPPLYYLLLHLWIQGTGRSLYALRFLSVAESLPMIALAYGLGNQLVSRRAGVLAAWLMALSPLQVYYAQELRMYAQVTVLGMASTLCLVHLMQSKKPAPSLWLGYWLTTLAAMYTHYQAFSLIAAQSLAALVFGARPRKRLLLWLSGMLGLAILYLPWVSAQARFIGLHSSGQPYALSLARLAMIVGQGLQSYMVGLAATPRFASIGALFGVFCGGLGLFALRKRPQSLAVLLFWLVCALGLWWLVDPLMPFFHSRFVILGAPALLLLIAAGLDWVAGRSRPATLVLLMSAAAVAAIPLRGWYTDPAYRKSYYGTAIADIVRRAQPGDIILLDNPEQQCLFDYYRPADLPWATLTPDDTLTLAGAGRALERLTQGHSRAWLITYGDTRVFDPQHNADRWLSSHGHWAYYRSYQGFYVRMYVLGEPPAAPPALLSAQFGNQIRFLGYDLRPQPASPDGTLLVTLYWQASVAPRADYTVFAQLLNDQGTLVAQLDGQPAGGSRPTSSWQPGETIVDSRAIPLPADLAPGTYDLWVGLYTWPDLKRLPLSAGSSGDALLVSKVTIQ